MFREFFYIDEIDTCDGGAIASQLVAAQSLLCLAFIVLCNAIKDRSGISLMINIRPLIKGGFIGIFKLVMNGRLSGYGQGGENILPI
jgi:hypothetical protein